MTVPLEKPTAEDIAYFNKTVVNAKRLAADSRLLVEHDRAYTAIMLAIFAIEELGKALITHWGVRNKKHNRRHPSHVEKQSAAFALLAAVELSEMSRDQFIEVKNAGGGFHEIGPLSSQFAYARSGFFDDYRMAVAYADRYPKIPLDQIRALIDVKLATEIIDWFELAGTSINNSPAMDLASTIFENDLGRM